MHKLINLHVHAPKTLHEALITDYRAMIDAETVKQVLACWQAFLRDPSVQWKSIRMAHAIEWLYEEFKRRINTPYAWCRVRTRPA